MDVIYRSLSINDALDFWNMMNELDNETKYMMYEPRERTKDIKRVEKLIQTAINEENFLLATEIEQEIVGYICAERGIPNRVRHTAYIVVGIRSKYQDHGIGTELFRYLDEWAVKYGIKRLELTVMVCNNVAKKLYERNGFIVEGTRKNAMLVDGQFIDEYYMAKLL